MYSSSPRRGSPDIMKFRCPSLQAIALVLVGIAATSTIAEAKQFKVGVELRDGSKQEMIIDCPQDPLRQSLDWIIGNCQPRDRQKDHKKWCNVAVISIGGHKAGGGGTGLTARDC